MPTTYDSRHSAWRHGFTLIELLVAIVLSLVMLAMIDRLFLDTSRTVATGIGLNDIMNNGQTFYDQIQRDAANMLGPHSDNTKAGFLVIINKQYPYSAAAQSPQIENARTGVQPANIRSDQLVFISQQSVPTHRSVTPGASRTFWNQATSSNAKIWYGHVLKTKPNGIPGNEYLGDEANRYANRWTLGRQALLLVNPTTLAGLTYSGSATQIYADGARYDSDTERALWHSGSAPTGWTAGDPPLYWGITDVCNKELGSADPSLPSSTDDIRYYLSTGDYRTKALDYAYAAQSGSTYCRLRFNPRASYKKDGQDSYEYQAWQVGQTHAAFLENVSDFVVEFAGDLDNDGVIDHETTGDNIGQIKWYSGYPLTGTDTDVPAHPLPANNDMLAGAAYTTNKVYKASNTGSGANYLTFASQFQPAASVASFPLADRAFVWRHDNHQAFTAASDPDNCSWPHLIRIRIRLHDAKGDVVGSTLSNVKDTATDPVLVANRGKTIPGRWFEQIIKVTPPPVP